MLPASEGGTDDTLLIPAFTPLQTHTFMKVMTDAIASLPTLHFETPHTPYMETVGNLGTFHKDF